MSPTGMMEQLEKDTQAKEQVLKAMPYDLLRDKDGLNLREYQLKAIQAAENAILNGQQNILLAMATGTGKTRTILGMIYRFLKTGRFRRILFLVDRTSLGEQATDVFKEVKLEDLMTLDDIYNIKGLEDKAADKETRIQVATVQSMVKRILYNGEDTMPAVTDFDLVIIDEAHRGYILDKEMGEDEVLYRDQTDYQSKYRSVVEYFDAVKIALTATPALQTTEIFGQPVYKYTYREAVIEGYLVDHDAPHELKTKLSQEGIHYKKGDTVTVYDTVTGEITNSELLNDELDFDVDKFNRKVITEPFNRAVLEEISRDIDPETPEVQGKTLIYAVDDQHADLIVKILKEIYAKTGVDAGSGLVHTITVTAANEHDITEAANLIREDDEVVYGDSGYLGIQKRPEIRQNEHFSNIDFRINRRPKSLPKVSDNTIDWERYIENRKSSVRCKVEHAFRIIKCQFGYRKTVYRGLKKNESRLYAMFACANLYSLAIAGRKLPTT